MQSPVLPPIALPPMQHFPTAYAVLFLDRQGRAVGRGVFSEEHPTIAGAMQRRRHAVRTVAVASARSRFSLDRAILKVLQVVERESRWRQAPSIGYPDTVARHIANMRARPRVMEALAV